jgi:hypothetical protein
MRSVQTVMRGVCFFSSHLLHTLTTNLFDISSVLCHFIYLGNADGTDLHRLQSKSFSAAVSEGISKSILAARSSTKLDRRGAPGSCSLLPFLWQQLRQYFMILVWLEVLILQ